jgi:hypothetical protein
VVTTDGVVGFVGASRAFRTSDEHRSGP